MVGGKGWGRWKDKYITETENNIILFKYFPCIIFNIEIIFYSVNFKIIPPNRHIFLYCYKIAKITMVWLSWFSLVNN